MESPNSILCLVIPAVELEMKLLQMHYELLTTTGRERLIRTRLIRSSTNSK